jgi:hypothetical protein
VEVGVGSIEVGLSSVEVEMGSVEVGVSTVEVGVSSVEVGMCSVEVGVGSAFEIRVCLLCKVFGLFGSSKIGPRAFTVLASEPLGKVISLSRQKE